MLKAMNFILNQVHTVLKLMDFMLKLMNFVEASPWGGFAALQSGDWLRR